MTTSPVMTATDELLAELEAGINSMTMRTAYASLIVAEIGRLRAENAELAKDAARLEWMLSEQCIMRVQNGTGSPLVYSLWWSTLGEGQINWHKSARDAIDTAMATQ